MKNLSQDVLCSLDLPSHPALMKEFYNDLSNGNNGIYGIVRVRTIKVDKEILERNLTELQEDKLAEFQDKNLTEIQEDFKDR